MSERGLAVLVVIFGYGLLCGWESRRVLEARNRQHQQRDEEVYALQQRIHGLEVKQAIQQHQNAEPAPAVEMAIAAQQRA